MTYRLTVELKSKARVAKLKRLAALPQYGTIARAIRDLIDNAEEKPVYKPITVIQAVQLNQDRSESV